MSRLLQPKKSSLSKRPLSPWANTRWHLWPPCEGIRLCIWHIYEIDKQEGLVSLTRKRCGSKIPEDERYQQDEATIVSFTYFGMSVLRSAPRAMPSGWGDPMSHTSIRGQACLFRWQKSRKSKASCPCLSTTMLHWRKPGHRPLVGPVYLPDRTSSRNLRTKSTSGWASRSGAPCQVSAGSSSCVTSGWDAHPVFRIWTCSLGGDLTGKTRVAASTTAGRDFRSSSNSDAVKVFMGLPAWVFRSGRKACIIRSCDDFAEFCSTASQSCGEAWGYGRLSVPISIPVEGSLLSSQNILVWECWTLTCQRGCRNYSDQKVRYFISWVVIKKEKCGHDVQTLKLTKIRNTAKGFPSLSSFFRNPLRNQMERFAFLCCVGPYHALPPIPGTLTVHRAQSRHQRHKSPKRSVETE